MVETHQQKMYDLPNEIILGNLFMSDIIKICKIHGPLTLDQVILEGAGRIRCHQCRLDSNAKWRENNREKHIKASTAWKEANRDRVNEWARKDREKNPEKYKVWSKTTKTKNREKILKDSREYQMTRRYSDYEGSLKREAEYRRRNSDHLYFKHCARRYKVTEAQFSDFMSKFDEKCTICRQPETRLTAKGEISRLCIDHCHTTGKLRGLLCHNCNNAIGAFRDNIEHIQAAIDYLKKYGGNDAGS